MGRSGSSGYSGGGSSSRPPSGSRPRPSYRPPSSGFGTGFGIGYAAGNHSSSHHSRPDGSYGYRPEGPSYPHHNSGNSGHSGGPRKGKSPVFAIIAIIIVVVLLIALMGALSSSGGIPSSTANREKLSGVSTFNSDCVEDSLGWLNDASKAGKDLKEFYDQTGVQPYIVFNPYDESLTTDQQKDEYAEDWYKNHIDNENTFVFMYFGTQHEGDGEPGYMCYVMGNRVDSVMDSEAVEIFWAYMDKNWYDDSLTENQVIVKTFTDTGERIMTKTRTGADVLIWLIVVVIIIGGLLLILRLRKQKRQHEAEKAKETEEILNTPLETSRDELLDKYTDEEDKK